MLKQLTMLLLSLCTLCTAASAQSAEKLAAKARKAEQKAQRKMLRQEERRFESLRNEAVLTFAKANQPKSIQTPMLIRNDLRISNIVCAGDDISGTVMIYMDVTPLLGAFQIFMGGERNGTCAIAKGNVYPSSDHYGRVYTLRSGEPEQVIVTFYNIAPGIQKLDRVDISMGLELATLNIITLRDLPIFWTYSDRAIRNFVRQQADKK